MSKLERRPELEPIELEPAVKESEAKANDDFSDILKPVDESPKTDHDQVPPNIDDLIDGISDPNPELELEGEDEKFFIENKILNLKKELDKEIIKLPPLTTIQKGGSEHADIDNRLRSLSMEILDISNRQAGFVKKIEKEVRELKKRVDHGNNPDTNHTSRLKNLRLILVALQKAAYIRTREFDTDLRRELAKDL